MTSYYLIFIGVVILLILIFIFRKRIKKAWFKIPFFEAGIETNTDQTLLVKKPQQIPENLRKIDEIETGKSIHDLPQNIYGFAHAAYVNSELEGYKGHLELTNLQKTNWYFEIQKKSDDIYLVGYVSRDSIAKTGASKILEITIFAQPWKEFKEKISIPFSKILKSSERVIDTKNGDIMILEIKTREIIIL